MVFVFSESIGCVVVPRLHVVEPDLSEVGEDDGAELSAEEAVDEGVHRRVAIADPQDNAVVEEIVTAIYYNLPVKLGFREDFHENFRKDFFPIESGPRGMKWTSLREGSVQP